MFFQIWNLTTHNSGNHIAHAVVVTQLLMLIPRSCFPALGWPLAYLLGICLGIGEEHSAGRTGNDLVSIETDAAVIAKAAGFFSFICSTQGFRCILNDHSSVGSCYLLDFINLARSSIQMRYYNHLDIRVYFKRLFQCHRVHIPGVTLGINKNRNTALINHRVHRGIESDIGTENFLIAQRSFSKFRLTIHGFPGKLHGKMERCRSCR